MTFEIIQYLLLYNEKIKSKNLLVLNVSQSLEIEQQINKLHKYITI